jgi:hypothetical protein
MNLGTVGTLLFLLFSLIIYRWPVLLVSFVLFFILFRRDKTIRKWIFALVAIVVYYIAFSLVCRLMGGPTGNVFSARFVTSFILEILISLLVLTFFKKWLFNKK